MRPPHDDCKADGMGLRVLIVDDSKSFLAAARLLLEREGLTVAGVASTGADALQQVAGEPFDVVLVDVFLGNESGFELARQLVEGADDTGTTVILISTYDKADFEDLLRSSPAAGFLSKPELSASAIRRIIDAPRR
jgi:two-component system, NarL family, nitrate/nitrite response regulator NarL